jgi:hypothetical protein
MSFLNSDSSLLNIIKRKSWFQKIIILCLCFSLSLYPIFRSIDTGLALSQFQNHKLFLEKKSWFYNPWQYRPFCPMLVEGIYFIYDHTVEKVISIKRVSTIISPSRFFISSNYSLFLNNKLEDFLPEGYAKKYYGVPLNDAIWQEYMRYFVVFIILRFLLHSIIYILAYQYFKLFLKSHWLAFVGILFLSFSIGNAYRHSDFSFNTYVDVILYLWAGIVIIKKKTPWIHLPIIMLIGIMNRESCVFIPLLYAASDFIIRKFKLNWRVIITTGLAYSIFVIGYFLIRQYYGFRAAPIGGNFHKFIENLGNYSVHSEHFAVVSVFPLISLLAFPKANIHLKIFFVILIPLWYLIHYYSFILYEVRHLLVPMALVYLPMSLQLFEQKLITSIQTSHD